MQKAVRQSAVAAEFTIAEFTIAAEPYSPVDDIHMYILYNIPPATGKYFKACFVAHLRLHETFTFPKRPYTRSVEFNLRHFSTIWSCSGKLQYEILTSRRRIVYNIFLS